MTCTILGVKRNAQSSDTFIREFVVIEDTLLCLAHTSPHAADVGLKCPVFGTWTGIHIRPSCAYGNLGGLKNQIWTRLEHARMHAPGSVWLS
jgi:hypothetical protein